MSRFESAFAADIRRDGFQTELEIVTSGEAAYRGRASGLGGGLRDRERQVSGGCGQGRSGVHTASINVAPLHRDHLLFGRLFLPDIPRLRDDRGASRQIMALR